VPAWIPPLLLSPFIGSFVAVLIRRLPRGEPVVLARSRCEACGHVLGPWELIPLVSAAVLDMRCRWCRVRIPFAHVAVELACLAIAGCVVVLESDNLLIWLDCILGWWLLALAWIDWDHMLLPDALTLPLLLAGLGATLLSDPAEIAGHAAAAAAGYHAAAAAAGYLAFRAIEIAYRWLRGRDGLGQGDARLLAAAGAWVGLVALPTVVFTAAVFGLALAACLRIAGRDVHGGTAIPFGPPLCAAIWVTFLGFDPILALADWLP
jgi:leader peptidase (prepilin peptidase)/N-methyltransferase